MIVGLFVNLAIGVLDDLVPDLVSVESSLGGRKVATLLSDLQDVLS